jgi:hypothetical protein
MLQKDGDLVEVLCDILMEKLSELNRDDFGNLI